MPILPSEEEELPSLADLELTEMWSTFCARRQVWTQYPRAPRTRSAFLAELQARISNPEGIDELGFCADCGSPDYDLDMYSTWSGSKVCDACISAYNECARCSLLTLARNITLDDDYVCDGCRNGYYQYCSTCEGYHHNDDSIDHNHGNGCCVAPGQSFLIRNDGTDPLANDTRIKVTLPAGEISDVGIGSIANLIRNYASDMFYSERIARSEYYNWASLANSLAELGVKWQTKQGNYTKRLSRLAYNKFKIKLSPELISSIGNIGSDHSKAVDFWVETTRQLDLSAREFCHPESCWWQSYGNSRCAFKTNGGFGLRSFHDGGGGPSGRVWVMPLRQNLRKSLRPTFETLEPDAYILFNGYEALSGYTPARIMSHMTGWTYRKVEFQGSPMYVNNSSGYLVAPEELASHYTDKHLSMSLDRHSDLFEREARDKKSETKMKKREVLIYA